MAPTTGGLVRRLSDTGPGINKLRFSPCGAWIASVDQEKTVRLWETASGSLLWNVSLRGLRAGYAVVALVFAVHGEA